jgi:hypothetical protein
LNCIEGAESWGRTNELYCNADFTNLTYDFTARST